MSHCDSCPLVPPLHPPFREVVSGPPDPLPDEPKPQSVEAVPRLSRCPGAAPSLYFDTCSLRSCQPQLHVRPGPSSCCSHPSHAPAAPSLWIEGEGGAGAPLESRAVHSPSCPWSDPQHTGAGLGGKGDPAAPQELCEAALDAALSQWGGEHQHPENIP